MSHSKPKRKQRSKNELFDSPIPEDIHNEDEIERLMLSRLTEYRKRPMTETEIAAGQAAVLSHFGNTPTATPTTDDAAKNEMPPFLVMCRRYFDHLTSMKSPNEGRGKRHQVTMQNATLKINAELAQSVLYSACNAAISPITFMIDAKNENRKGSDSQMALVRTQEGNKTLFDMIQIIEGLTGFNLEGALVSRSKKLMCAVFDHIDTPRHAIVVILLINEKSLPAFHNFSMSAMDIDGDDDDAMDHELFDSVYFKRENKSESPWIALSASYVNYVYFDRLANPYEGLFANQ